MVYVLATIALVIVGLNIGKLAGKISAAGSFFIYVSRGLGPSYGLLSGWAMLAAYIFTAMALTGATTIFVQALLTSLGVTTPISNVVIYFGLSFLIWLFATRDIRLSSRVSLSLEVVSVTILSIVCFMTWAKHGFSVDQAQISLKGSSFSAVAQAIVFGIFSYVGFESSATLGRETRNPLKVIPRAIILTVVLAGVFFIITTFIITQGFNDDTNKLGGSSSPMTDLVAGMNPLWAIAVYVGALVSCFACGLASINSFSRMLFSLGRYQFVHKSMGTVHAEHRTPHVAVTVGVVLNFLVCWACSSHSPTDLLGFFGTIASFGFIIVYLLCSIAAPVLLAKLGEAKPLDYVLGGLGALFMALSLVGSVYPVPAAPYNYFPYGFAIYMALGAVWFFILKARAPQVLLGIEHDLETANQ
jgi:amino acid transporter